jgi:hypothetical protein
MDIKNNNYKHWCDYDIKKKPKFIFTRHLRKRFLERFCNTKETKNLKGRDLDIRIAITLKDAKENKAIYNNTNFIQFCTEKHGYENFQFYCTDDIIFVVVQKNTDKTIVTCMSRKSHRIPHLAEKHNKYKKKQKNNDDIMFQTVKKRRRIY